MKSSGTTYQDPEGSQRGLHAEHVSRTHANIGKTGWQLSGRMAEAMKISVAMATYNGDKYLQMQLESIAAQTRLPDELIVADDCSMDNTLALLASFAGSAPFRTEIYENSARLGYVQNFSRAMCLSSGDLVFLCDQDDYWLPEKIEAVSRAADENPSMMLFVNDAYITDDDLAPTGQTILSRLRKAGMAQSSLIHGCCTAMRRPLLDIALPIPEDSSAKDRWLAGLSFDFGVRFILEQPLQLYRRHQASAAQQSITGGTAPLTRGKYVRLEIGRRLRASTSSYLDSYAAKTNLRLIRIREWMKTAPESHQLHASAALVAQKLERRTAAIRARLSILQLPRRRRVLLILGMVLRKQYSEVGGCRSAARDLLV